MKLAKKEHAKGNGENEVKLDGVINLCDHLLDESLDLMEEG